MGSYKLLATAPPMSPIDVHVGYRIAHIRASAGMSEFDLAVHLKVPLEDLHGWEAGAERIPATHLVTITKVLACPLSAFFEGLVADDHH